MHNVSFQQTSSEHLYKTNSSQKLLKLMFYHNSTWIRSLSFDGNVQICRNMTEIMLKRRYTLAQTKQTNKYVRTPSIIPGLNYEQCGRKNHSKVSECVQMY